MEKINVAELLKGCPSGMELDCAMYENVYFNQIYENENCLYSIGCYTIVDGIRTSINFTKFGEFNIHMNSKCVIFPKGKTTWKGFVPPCKFKDGDIVTCKDGGLLVACIYKERKNTESFNHHIALYKGCLGILVNGEIALTDDKLSFATEEEKAKLFKAIKYKGYKWNEETKTLEKLPKFNVGNKIKRKGDTRLTTIKDIRDNYYIITIPDYFDNAYITDKLLFSNQDEYEIIPNKFDITTLKPFDKVLARCSTLDKWRIQFFEKYDKTCKYPFICMGYNKYKQCIPYEGNEHLFDTTDDCDEYFKTWK